KERHENALHIFLPDSMTTWVYLNLDVEMHDFKFWMAHELGHGFAPQLTGDAAEDFADRFAGTLLFPEPLAQEAYRQIKTNWGKATQVNFIKRLAEDNLISPVSVYYEINHYAESQGSPRIEFGDAIFGAAKNLSKGYNNVSATLFDNARPDVKSYMERCKEVFDTPFFASLKTYLVEEHKSHGYVQAILDIPLLDAKEVHAALV
ncbi:MAG: ImmA/IrrE family metallo-endopeptidase, partial [Gammaproteobacteria bacterium]